MSQSAVSARQLKAARALAGFSRKDLAARSAVAAGLIKEVEQADADPATPAEIAALLKAALEAAGVEFTDGGTAGVRLKPPSEGLRPEDLNASNDD